MTTTAVLTDEERQALLKLQELPKRESEDGHNGFVVLDIQKPPAKLIAKGLGMSNNKAGKVLTSLRKKGMYDLTYTPGERGTRTYMVHAAKMELEPAMDPIAQIGAHKSMLVKLEERVGTMLKDKADLQVENEELRATIAKKDSHISDLESQLADCRSSRSALEDELASLQLPEGLQQFVSGD